MEKAKGKSCATCKWENEKLNPCVFCININSPLASEWEQKKPKTNADRIRAMTDEELANMWWSYVDCGECPMHRECNMLPQDCLRLALKWLRQEATDG